MWDPKTLASQREARREELRALEMSDANSRVEEGVPHEAEEGEVGDTPPTSYYTTTMLTKKISSSTRTEPAEGEGERDSLWRYRFSLSMPVPHYRDRFLPTQRRILGLPFPHTRAFMVFLQLSKAFVTFFVLYRGLVQNIDREDLRVVSTVVFTSSDPKFNSTNLYNTTTASITSQNNYSVTVWALLLIPLTNVISLALFVFGWDAFGKEELYYQMLLRGVVVDYANTPFYTSLPIFLILCTMLFTLLLGINTSWTLYAQVILPMVSFMALDVMLTYMRLLNTETQLIPMNMFLKGPKHKQDAMGEDTRTTMQLFVEWVNNLVLVRERSVRDLLRHFWSADLSDIPGIDHFIRQHKAFRHNVPMTEDGDYNSSGSDSAPVTPYDFHYDVLAALLRKHSSSNTLSSILVMLQEQSLQKKQKNMAKKQRLAGGANERVVVANCCGRNTSSFCQLITAYYFTYALTTNSSLIVFFLSILMGNLGNLYGLYLLFYDDSYKR